MKMIAGLSALMLLSTPVSAHDRNSRDHQYERREDRHRGPTFGQRLLEAIIIQSVVNDRYDRRYDDRQVQYYDPYEDDRYSMPRRPRYYEHYCVTEQITDRRGTYYRKTCQ